MRTQRHRNHEQPTTTTTADRPDVLTPEAAWAQGPIRHARRVWPLGEDGEAGYLAEGHDHRALAAINALGRDDHGPRWATHPAEPLDCLAGPATTPHRRWVRIHTTCGCSTDQHAEHVTTERHAPDWDGCPCRNWGLPPCEPDRFAWLYTIVPAATPNAVAVTEVTW
jgi:hypothetical protein